MTTIIAEIRESTGPGAWSAYDIDENGCVDVSGLTPGSTYDFQLRTLDDTPGGATVFAEFTWTMPGISDTLTYIPLYGQSLSLGNDPDGGGAFETTADPVSLDPAQNITAVTAANPIVITCPGHGFSEGDTVLIRGDVGNGASALGSATLEVVNPTADTFEVGSHDGNVPSQTMVDGTGLSAYSGGATVARCTPSSLHFMFNGGVRPHYDDPDISNVNSASWVDTQNSFIPLAERRVGGLYTETLATGALSKVTSRPCAISCFGRGATGIAGLHWGTIPYGNTVQSVIQAQEKNTLANFDIGPMIWKHGEADGGAGTSRADYKSLLIAMRSDFEEAFKTAGLLPDLTLPLVSDQLGQSSSGYAEIAVALIEAHREDANVYCLGPSYWHDYYTAVNDVHLSPTGYRVVGEYFGLAVNSILNGNGWEPCHINSAPTRSGTTITVPVHVPSPPLVKDTTLVASVANDGFAYTGASITNVSITDDGSGDNQGEITITIDADAGGDLRYAYVNGASAYNGATLGARGNIRDSATATASFNGDNLYNWLCVDEWSVT